MKKVLILGICLFILIICSIVYFFTTKEKTYTISFDTAGGNKVEKLSVRKYKQLKLPTPKKEGYVFIGWFVNDKKVDSNYKFSQDTLLTAKWQKESKCLIRFDSKGGNSIPDMTYEEKNPITLPKPTREGYNFIAWYTKDDVPITDGALLMCEKFKLTAKWLKK